jgi:hypothetical protein
VLEIEKQSLTLINQVLAIKDLPIKKIKSLVFGWEEVGGSFVLPKLNIQFYKTEEERNENVSDNEGTR